MVKKKIFFELRESARNLGNSLLNKNHTLHYKHQEKELRAFKDYFNTVEDNPLTLSQRKAIVLDEKRNLIIAGAGSGKTSVLVGKCGYILKKGLASEAEILLLAYNNDAANELKERIKQKIGAQVKVKTFHALGLEIIDGSNDETIQISDLLSQRKEGLDLFDQFLLQVVNDSKVYKSLSSYLSNHIIPYTDEMEEFNSLKDYKNWISRNSLITLQGENVKSYGELVIANFLFLNGVKYKYEDIYSPKNNKLKDRYRPDFHLIDTDIYIEYFGIDKEGNTASYIDKEKYNKEIEWKKNLHKENNTNLIELFYYNLKEGELEPKLRKALSDQNVNLSKISDKKTLLAAKEVQYTSKLFNLLKTFLGHFKSNKLTVENLKSRHGSRIRNSLFLDIFESFFELYTKKLAELNSIDFDDMILKGTELVQSGDYQFNLKYILVDEYQDISMSRFNLVTSLLKQNPEAKLFCVGDDWQSIYRFSGADVGLMTNFRDYLGKNTTIEKLDLTFRYNKTLAEVSGKFIQENRNQIRKTVNTYNKSEDKSVKIHYRASIKDAPFEVIRFIQEKNEASNNSKILFLARYSRNLPDFELLKKMNRSWKGSVEAMTCHASKGLQADYVILCDAVSSDLGFPSEVSDDPVLYMVLNQVDHFPNEEERRLFYVALTRAKKEVHIITTYANPSIFVEEIKQYNNIDIIESGNHKKIKCPSCDSGEIVESQSGFLYCTNRPLCEYAPPRCPKCKKSQMTKVDNLYVCEGEGCNYSAASCPACEDGYLIERAGKYGQFFGCSNFASTGCKGK